MLKGLSHSLNWKLQIIFNAIAVASVVVISLGGYNASSQFAEKLGEAQAREYLDSLALQAVILGVAVNAGVGAFAFFMARKITKPITKATEIASKISQGDLTVTFEELKSDDEIGKLVNAQNKMVTNLKDIISQVHTAAQAVSAGSQQIAASGNEMGGAVQQISSTVDQISRGSASQAQELSKSRQAIDDLAATIAQLAKDAIESVEITQKVGSLSERGSESAKEAGERMNNIIKVTNESAQKVKGLAEKTNEITMVLDVIKQIADQTNLLALNAAIEAARAGEAGRGFAVVADEVRRLAENSSRSSEEIDAKLKQIHGDAQVVVEGIELSANEVNQGKMVIESSLKTLDEIATQIRNISDNVKRLSDATQEEVIKVKQVSTTAADIAAVAEQNVSATEEAAAAVEEQTAQTHEIANAANQMSQLATQLETRLAQFKLAQVATEPKTENPKKENIPTELVQK
jgi:methyl-accepting chemotaxis protein